MAIDAVDRSRLGALRTEISLEIQNSIIARPGLTSFSKTGRKVTRLIWPRRSSLAGCVCLIRRPRSLHLPDAGKRDGQKDSTRDTAGAEEHLSQLGAKER